MYLGQCQKKWMLFDVFSKPKNKKSFKNSFPAQ